MTSAHLIFQDSTKTEKMHESAKAIFNILLAKSVEDVSFSQVARRAKVSRPWLYKYIGSKKEDLVHFAIEYIGKYITTLDINEVIETREQFRDHITRGIKRMFVICEEYPFFTPVYFRYKGTKTVPGESMKLVEQAYIKRQTSIITKLYNMDLTTAEVTAEMLTGFRMVLAYNWQRGELKNKANEEFITQIIHHYLTELLGPYTR